MFVDYTGWQTATGSTVNSKNSCCTIGYIYNKTMVNSKKLIAVFK